jgi:hypothetical protein
MQIIKTITKVVFGNTYDLVYLNYFIESVVNPNPSELTIDRIVEVLTCLCCIIVRRSVVRSEKLIELGYSWFSTKPILVGNGINK